jgi:NAD(P)-dependent dehydrogenase (short-subunit alcohol dehydrogenase family)
MQVHVKGTWATMRWAGAYWRERTKAGETNDARVINTSSASGLYGNPGQTNYGAAKAGIASMSIIAGKELERYGVTVNAIAPGARTRMTEGLGFGAVELKPDEFDAFAPENISPIVVWLGSPESRDVNCRVFNVAGGSLSVAEGWHRGPGAEKGDRWEPSELGPVVKDMLEKAAPLPGMMG